ncbi:MAG: ATP-binding protein [Saccharofermentanales bacterium]
MKNYRQILFQSAMTILISASATGISMLARSIGFSETNIVVIFILSVLIVANVTKGYFYGISASIIGMFSFNFFFTEPIHTFNVNNKNYIITFSVMLAASILTSTLTSKIVKSSAIAGKREKQSQILYQISSSLAKTSSIHDVAIVSVQTISNLLDCDVSFVSFDESNKITKEYSIKKNDRQVIVNEISEKQLMLSKNGKFILNIADNKNKFGVIFIPDGCITGDDEQKKLLDSIATQIYIAIERERLANEKEAAKNEAKQEKYKSNLLRSISHDIRTPLSGITGAAEVLMFSLKDDDRIKLVQGIYDDSLWLNRMVENILNLTKIQEDNFHVNKQMEAVEEIVGAVVKHSAKFSGSHRISVEIPDQVLFVPMDATLIVQVFINLIENAVKYSPESSEIKISVTPAREYVWFSVTDHGKGIKSEDLPKVFDLFFVSEDSLVDSKRGNGLGLTICKAIVTAHGGKIFAENNINGGLTVRFSLPLEGGDKFGKR